MIMRVFIFIVFVSGWLFGGYHSGSKISPDIVKRLHLGKGITVVDFFASWCHSCEKEMVGLSKLSGRYRVVGVDVDKKPADGKRFQKKMRAAGKLRFRIFNDTRGSIIGRFGPPGVPALYVIKDGKIIATVIGAKNNIDSYVTRKIRNTK